MALTESERLANEALAMQGLQPAMIGRHGDKYAPFAEAYNRNTNLDGSPISNPREAFLREAAAGTASLRATLLTKSGMSFPVRLTEADTTAIAACATLELRNATTNTAAMRVLRESAASAADRLKANNDLEKLHPTEEALLRELGMLASDGDGKWVLRESDSTLREDLSFNGYFGDEATQSSSSTVLANAYLPYGQGPSGQQLYLAEQWSMLAKCLAGDTVIPLIDGTDPTIAELAERGGEVWVYSSDSDGQISPGRAHSARLSGVKDTIFVDLDNGETIRVTHDHRMLMRDGTYVVAGLLFADDSLMPFNRNGWKSFPSERRVVAIRPAGPCDVYDLTVDGTANFAIGQGVIVHNSFYLWHHNPIAFNGIEMIKNFVLGRGIRIVAEKQEVQTVIDEFTKRVKLDELLDTWVVDLLRDGEHFVIKMPDGRGKMDVDIADPTTIWEIVTDALRIKDVKYYRQQFQTRSQLFSPGNNQPNQVYVQRDLPPKSVIHTKINASASEVRGRSILFPSFGWFKMLTDHFTTIVISDMSGAATSWDVTVDGNLADVQAVQNAFVVPTSQEPGGANFHSKTVTVEKMGGAANAGTSAAGSTYQGIITLAVNAMSLSVEYFGIGGNAPTQAASLMSSDPSMKHMHSFQKLVRQRMVEPIIEAVILEAFTKGDLRSISAKDLNVRVEFPEIIAGDIADLRKALEEGVAMDFISHRTAAERYAAEHGFHGYDYDAEMKALEKEMDGLFDPIVDPLTGKEQINKATGKPKPLPKPWHFIWKNYQQMERFTNPTLSPLTPDPNDPVAAALSLPGTDPNAAKPAFGGKLVAGPKPKPALTGPDPTPTPPKSPNGKVGAASIRQKSK